MRRHVIALVDCANFYVSCERSFNATLHNRPVVVLSNNDANIVAASQEAKLLGLVRGMPYFQARPLLEMHHVAVYSSNYSLYQSVSDQIMQLLAPYAEERDGVRQQEIYSIDECFLSLAHVAPEHLLDQARIMQSKILRITGIPVRIGLGRTKVISKIAIEVGKRDMTYHGVVNLADSECQELTAILEQIAVEDIWGLNKRSCAKLREHSITTARAFRDADPVWIRRVLHVTRQRILYELRGLSCLPLEVATKPKKGIMASRAFGRLVHTYEELSEAISSYAAMAGQKLRQQNSAAVSISIFISTNPFDTTSPHYAKWEVKQLSRPTNFTPDLMAAARELLKEIFRPEYQYKRAGVFLSEIQPEEVTQFHLFESYSYEDEAKKARLMAVVDIIHLFIGRDAIFWGAQGFQRKWKTKAQHLSKRYTTRWNELLLVQ